MTRNPIRTLAPILLALGALLLGGCRELQELRHIKALQDDQIRQLRGELESEKDKYHRYATTSSAEVESLKSRVETSQRELRRAQNERTERERRLASQLEGLRGKLDVAESELATLRSQSESLSSKAADRALAAEKLGERAAELEKRLEEKTREARILERNAEQAKEQSETATSKLGKQTEEMKALKTKLAKATERAERLEASTKNLSTQIAKLQEAMKETSNEKTGVVEELRKEAARMQEQIGKMEQGELVMDADFRDALGLFKASLKPVSDADYATVGTDSRGIVVRFAASYLFKDGVSLDPAVLPTLDQIAEILNRFPRKHIEIQGHTDTEAIINLPYTDNWALASARAAAVTRYLTNQAGVAPRRVKMSSCSQYRPLAANEKKDDRMDRRVEIVLTNRP